MCVCPLGVCPGGIFLSQRKDTLSFRKILALVSSCSILVVLVFLWACSSGTEGKSKPQGPAVIPVEVAPAVQKDVPVSLQFIGNVEAYRVVSIKSMVAGEISQVNFKEGQDLKKGDLLFVIDPRPFEAALRQTQANLATDIVQAKNAEEEARRYAYLVEKNYVAREQYDQMKTNAEAFKATVESDRAAVNNARIQLQYCYIRCPIDGRAGSILVQLGNVVKANDVPLVTINQINPIYVTFSAPEQDLAEIRKYMGRGKVKVDALLSGEEKTPEQGTLTFIDNQVDLTTGTVKLKGTFENQDRRLWPGQFVNAVLILTTQPKATVIPSQAVQTGQQGQYVFVVKPDRTVDMRSVVVSRTVGGDSVISQGLVPGEDVVTDGQLRLSPGARVEIKSAVQGAKPS